MNLFLVRLLGCFFIVSIMGCAGPVQTGNAPQLQSLPGIPVYAAGDIADCRRALPENSGAAATAALIESELKKNAQSVVLALGDSTYPNGHQSEFARCYEPTWGRFKNRTYPAPGNHEYRTPAAADYFQYFGAAAGNDGRGYYSFHVGDWHVISLNSNLQGDSFSTQMDWLKSELDQSAARCTLAYWHHPVFSSGEHGNTDVMLPAWRLLAAANVELVLAAHDHHYERFAPRDHMGKPDSMHGIAQFVVGTGGARLTPIRPFRKQSESSSNASHGALKLVLMPGSYAWEFLPVTPGAHDDRGFGTCH